MCIIFFFFNDTATTEIYTLSLHDALPIFDQAFGQYPHLICYAVKANSNLAVLNLLARLGSGFDIVSVGELERDRKSTRLNSSHSQISYAVFCLKKKKKLTKYNESHT